MTTTTTHSLQNDMNEQIHFIELYIQSVRAVLCVYVDMLYTRAKYNDPYDDDVVVIVHIVRS